MDQAKQTAFWHVRLQATSIEVKYAQKGIRQNEGLNALSTTDGILSTEPESVFHQLPDDGWVQRDESQEQEHADRCLQNCGKERDHA